MRCRVTLSHTVCCLVFLTSATFAAEPATSYRSHPPVRPLPAASRRPLPEGVLRFVDATRGDDGGDGSKEGPWHTLAHALTRLRPGDTLCLHGGTYYEAVTVSLRGTAEKPITIRSCANELAVIDGGLREFAESPATAWQPVSEGAAGEYRSTKAYPGRAGKESRRDVHVLGNFGDSLVPLHGYRYLIDFRTDNQFWNIENKEDTKAGVYVGPGVWYDPDDGRIHARLSHLTARGYGADSYRGETDPRKLALVISGTQTPLAVEKAAHVIFQDLVVRGATSATVRVSQCEDVRFDGVTLYGGSPALSVEQTTGLRLTGCAVRGLSAPWSSRASHKYRGKSPYLLTCGRGNRDFEFSYCEFTDNHDGLVIGTVLGLDFHHNLVENFDDDGLYLYALTTGGNLRIHENFLSRSLSMLSFAGSQPPGRGVQVYRNVFDLRRPNYGSPPEDGQAQTPALRPSRAWGEHGSPTWEPLKLYHNTVLLPETEWRQYYAAGWASHTQKTQRWIFNNLFVHVEGMPGLNFSSLDDDLQADGNLHWGLKEGPTFPGDFFAAWRASPKFAATKKHYPDGWCAHDLFADPRLEKVSADWRMPADVRLQEDSRAIDAGLPLPADWPDPLRAADRGRPDIGALPLGTKMFAVGPAGRTKE